MTTSSVFSNIRNHFEKIADQLVAETEVASGLTNSSDVGASREDVYKRFLERHLPKTCNVFLGGYVFDIDGNRSKQTDIIVTAGNTPKFEMSTGNKHFAPLEGTIAIVEVKSHLNKQSLYDALENIAAIPSMPNQKGILSPVVKYSIQHWLDIPYKIILAYGAINKETLFEHICEFYKKNDSIPINRRPNIIHILKNSTEEEQGYVMVRMTPEMQIMESDGSLTTEQVKDGEYRWFYPNHNVLAMAWILDSIKQNNFIINFSKFNYRQWINRLADEIIKSRH